MRFIDDPLVPLDNNQEVPDIRIMMVKMKISGGFRNSDTADAMA